MKFFVYIFIIFSVSPIFLPAGASEEIESVYKPLEYGTASGFPFYPAEYKVFGADINDSNKIYGISVNGKHKMEDSGVLRYNLAAKPPKTESWYLSNKILLSGKKSMLDSLVPEGYLTADLPSRDKAPISRFSQGADEDTESGPADIKIKASNTLLNAFFGKVTGNIFTLNIIPGVKDAVSVRLRPAKNLILKFNALGEQTLDISNVEITLLPSDRTNISFKTSEDGPETKTGIEFQMFF